MKIYVSDFICLLIMNPKSNFKNGGLILQKVVRLEWKLWSLRYLITNPKSNFEKPKNFENSKKSKNFSTNFSQILPLSIIDQLLSVKSQKNIKNLLRKCKKNENKRYLHLLKGYKILNEFMICTANR